jgi:prophage antirepressor-like protein
MDNLQIFENNEFGEIRVIKKNNEPWFVAKDLCEALDINWQGNKTLVAIKKEWTMGREIPDSLGRKQKTYLINEAGMYKLVFRSRKEEAEKFTDWIAEEVLPSIRKTGIYATDETIDKILADPDFGIELLSQLKEERKEKQKLVGKINDLKPKADYTDTILKNKGLVTITQIAKDYGMSGRKMNELLHDLGVQYKQSGQWLLYAEHQGEGYTHSETIDITRSDGTPDVVMNTKWTQKGRLFLYNLLKNNGILPVIERGEVDEKDNY